MSRSQERRHAGGGVQVHSHGARPAAYDFGRDPFILFWEITRACALACVHCRAEAQPKRHPLELSTEEAERVIDDIAGFDVPPILILSGGDPFMRRDLFDIVERARKRGLTVAVAPSATALVTRKRLRRLADLGVSSVSFSLDGASAETHDSFRGIAGTYDRTMEVMDSAAGSGMPFQINTTVSRRTVGELPEMARQLAKMGPAAWDLFFLVPTGRAAREDVLSPRRQEDIFTWVMDNQEQWPFRVKTTLAPHFRRAFVLRRMRADPLAPVPRSAMTAIREGWPGPPTNDGRGTLFISHLGDIYPSGFLPVRAGNVRKDSVRDVYRSSKVFTDLRDAGLLKGKCGVCPFNEICGGSRARAYAMEGDMLASDPTCAYQPSAA